MGAEEMAAMSEDKVPLSAYELAMRRLEARDRAEGVEKSRPLTDPQKEAIAEARTEAKAKLAELEILHRKNLAAAGGDAEAIRKLEENYRTDRARIEDRAETRIAKIKREGSAPTKS